MKTGVSTILVRRSPLVLVFGSLAAVVFCALLALQIISARLVGANIGSDTFQPVLVDIAAHRTTFALSAGLGALAPACFVPMALAIWESTDVQDRAFAAMIGLFMLISCVLLVDAYAHLGNLVGVASDYMDSASLRDVVVLQGDNLGDQYQILQYAGLVSFGIGLLIWSWLMTRSPLYPKPMSWLTWGLGLLSFASVIQPAPMVAVRLIWSAALSVVWLRSGRAEALAQAESSTP